jgi:sugar phosphate isomerase/epimerase
MERTGDQLEVLVQRTRQLGVRLSVENHADFNVPGVLIGWWPTVNFGTGKIDIAKRVNHLIQRRFEGPIAIELSNLEAELDEIGVAEQAINYLRTNL